MDSSEILAAVDQHIDMILSLDIGNYKNFLTIPKNIPITPQISCCPLVSVRHYPAPEAVVFHANNSSTVAGVQAERRM